MGEKGGEGIRFGNAVNEELKALVGAFSGGAVEEHHSLSPPHWSYKSYVTYKSLFLSDFHSPSDIKQRRDRLVTVDPLDGIRQQGGHAQRGHFGPMGLRHAVRGKDFLNR